MPSPSDHAKMLTELLRPAGPELARRWLAALLLAPVEEREGIVAAVEQKISEMYTDAVPRTFRVRSPAVQKDGHTEETITDYSAPERSSEQTATPREARA